MAALHSFSFPLAEFSFVYLPDKTGVSIFNDSAAAE
jgi:hypothetical protein